MNEYALLILVFCTGIMIGCIIGYSCKATKEELKPNKFEEYNQRILKKEREVKDNQIPEIRTENEQKYVSYIEEHINNVKLVWKELQPFLDNEFWLDDFTYETINQILEVHDASKYNQDEFCPYRQYFYPDIDEVSNLRYFNEGWNTHQKTNSHHWQYWILIEDSGNVVILDMSFCSIIEMLCDWTAMSIKFNNSPTEWYLKNKGNMKLSEKTEKYINRWMPLFEQTYKAIKEGGK